MRYQPAYYVKLASRTPYVTETCALLEVLKPKEPRLSTSLITIISVITYSSRGHRRPGKRPGGPLKGLGMPPRDRTIPLEVEASEEVSAMGTGRAGVGGRLQSSKPATSREVT